MISQRRPFPHVPGPWNNPTLPRELQELDFVFLRTHLPPNSPIMQQALEARQPFRPAALLPMKFGPRNHAVNAMRAFLASNGRRRTLVRQATQGLPIPFPRPGVPVAMPNAAAKMWPTPPPGYGIKDVPFRPRATLPAAAMARRAQLLQPTQGAGRTGGADAVEALVQQMSGTFYGDPFAKTENY